MYTILIHDKEGILFADSEHSYNLSITVKHCSFDICDISLS